MLTFPAGVRLFFATGPTDLRKSFDGLSAIVEHEFGLQPRSGDLFIFLNRRTTQVRMLLSDRDGYCVIAKRLEAGTFRRVRQADGETTHVEICRCAPSRDQVIYRVMGPRGGPVTVR